MHPSTFTIIVAGGSGVRMGTTIPKQFLPLAGKPMLYWSIKAFADTLKNLRIIVVIPAAYMEEGKAVIRLFEDDKIDALLAPGGDTRYASVAAGLALVAIPSVVLVHDAARPMVTREVIRRCYDGAGTMGSAVPVIPVADSIRQVDGPRNHGFPRDNLRIVQTPQAFGAALLKEAFKQPYRPAFTDEASVVEWSGHQVHLVAGARNNFKITTEEDMVLAEALMREWLK